MYRRRACVVGRRIEQQVTVFGDEDEDEAVHEAEELLVVALLVELAGAELLAERLVGLVGEEALA